MKTKGKSRVMTGVVMTDRSTVVQVLQHVCDPTQSIAQQARELRDWLRSSLGAYSIEAAILFEADHAPRASDTEASRSRLRLEGAAITAVLDSVPRVEIRNGRGLGALSRVSKADALALADPLPIDDFYREAAAAAIAVFGLTT
jgi:hypothetical protein